MLLISCHFFKKWFKCQAMQGYNKKFFFWWPNKNSFALTTKYSHAFATTIKDIVNLMKELLNKKYDYILTARSQSGPNVVLVSIAKSFKWRTPKKMRKTWTIRSTFMAKNKRFNEKNKRRCKRYIKSGT